MFAEVLPKNARTAKILKEREEEEQKRKEKEAAVSLLRYMMNWLIILFVAQLEARKAKEEKERKKEKDRAQLEKARRDLAARENAKKEQEQQEASKRIQGKLLLFLQKAQDDTTPKDFSLSGCDLGGPRTSIVARVIAFNKSLTTLHLCRKNI